jgi:hypothetical protein
MKGAIPELVSANVSIDEYATESIGSNTRGAVQPIAVSAKHAITSGKLSRGTISVQGIP